MPRILAIDWDRLEARALVLQSGATGTSIAGAWAVPLSSQEGAAPTVEQVGAQLASVLAGQVSGGVTTLVGVGREQVQMVLLSLPPAPPEELPELVRFQAERELTSLGDDAALDFIPLSGDTLTPHQVLVSALAGAGLKEVSDICQAVGVEPDRITLRATAAASFVARRLAAEANEVSLVVHRLTDEADLTVLVGDQVVLVRSVRLPVPSETAARRRALVGEIRRTLAAVRQQLADQQVDRVVLCGTAAEASDAPNFSEEVGLPVELFDVADIAPSGLERASVSRDAVPRLAAVLGMALGEADRRRPVVDFLNVRRRPEPRRFTRTHAMAGGIAAVVLLLVGLFLWWYSGRTARDLRRVNIEVAGLETEFSTNNYGQSVAHAAAIERWLSTDVNWLAELERLSRQWRPEPLESEQFPVETDAIVTQFTAYRPPLTGVPGGVVDVQAIAKSAAAIAPLEQRLRDQAHRVSTGIGKQDSSVPSYGWSVNLRVNVAAETSDEEDAR